MFPRKKKNKTGTISVVVIDKSNGYKEVKNLGVVKTVEEADLLMTKARQWIRAAHGQREIDFAGSSVMQSERLEVERVMSNISSVVLNGPRRTHQEGAVHRHRLDTLAGEDHWRLP